jgi:hypothetical protein
MRSPRILLPLYLSMALLWSCSGGHSGSNSTPVPVSDPPPPAATLSISTTSLPNAQVGHAYSVSLAAKGGTPPLTWSLTSGTLPVGLTLTAATGAISGTPTATANGTSLTFAVKDSGSPQQSKSVTLKLNVNPASITVTVSPARAGVTINQTVTLSATSNDPAGVTWSVAAGGGTLSASSSASGAPVTYTAPANAGAYTVTAASVTDSTQQAGATIGVTDLAGVYTYHDDAARDGANTHEYALTPATVSTATFGKLFSCSVDGAIYAQPLWVANVTIGGARHNVVFVATAHDGLFAFDADTSPCQALWQVNLIDANHGATAGEVPVPNGPTGYKVGVGYGNISPEVGVIGTPVIDPGSGTLYVVSKSMNPAGTAFYQRLHAIDITSGNERSGSPAGIAGSYPVAAGGSLDFSAQQQNQRAGLALVGGNVYIAWGSHEDSIPWHGWMMGYSGASLAQSAVLSTTPNVVGGGIWMGGGAPAADVSGNLYVITGNGPLDAMNGSGPTNDYGDSLLQLSSTLTVGSWFSPSDQANDDANDVDFGSGGAAVVLNLSTGSLRRLIVGGGKDGTLYVLNGDNLGGLGDSQAWQYFAVGHGIFSTGAFWNNTLYLGPAGSAMLAYSFDPATNMFNATQTSLSATTFGWPGSTPSVSAAGASSNGILWGLDTSKYCTPRGTQTTPCGPAVLHAYDASNLATELWNSAAVSSDAAGYAVKFTVPTVANGKVYVGTRGNDSFNGTPPSIPGELDVYGLKP